MPKTDAQKRAQAQYMKQFAMARVRMPKDKYRCIQEHAKAHSESVNEFIVRAIDEAMDHDRDMDIAQNIAYEYGLSRDEVIQDEEFARVLDRFPELKDFVFRRR